MAAANCPTTREFATNSPRLFVEVLTKLKTDALADHMSLSMSLLKNDAVGMERETPEKCGLEKCGGSDQKDACLLDRS